jgi:hypothetical protein
MYRAEELLAPWTKNTIPMTMRKTVITHACIRLILPSLPSADGYTHPVLDQFEVGLEGAESQLKGRGFEGPRPGIYQVYRASITATHAHITHIHSLTAGRRGWC